MSTTSSRADATFSRRVRCALALAVCAGVLASESVAQAQQASKLRFGVVVLDDAQGSREIARGVVRTLDSYKYEVLDPYAVRRRLEERHVPPPSDEVGARFEGFTSMISDGVKAYFYDGTKTAIKYLAPAFNTGVTNREMLAHRPDRAAQVYEAAVVLMRAYRDRGDQENADAIASLLARHYPHHLPSTASAPPEVQALVKARIQELLDPATSIVLRPLGPARECTVTLNGIEVEVGTSYPVDPTLDYFVSLDCPSFSPSVWRLSPPAGQVSEVPLVSGDPLEVAMSASDEASRQRAEDRLRAVRFWADIDLLLGVSSAAASELEEHDVLLARVEATRQPVWSDETAREGLDTLLPALLPEYIHEPGSAPLATADAPPRERRASGKLGKAAPLILAGAGLAGVGVSGYFLREANQEYVRTICSEANGSRDPDRCADVEDAYTYEDLGDTEQEQIDTLQLYLTDATRSRRIAAGATIATGVLAVGGLTWWLLRRRDPAEAALLLQPSPSRVELLFLRRF